MGTPAKQATQVAEIKQDGSHGGPPQQPEKSSVAYSNYATPPKKSGPEPLFFPATTHTDYVPLRSKPIAVTEVENPSGSVSYRVRGASFAEFIGKKILLVEIRGEQVTDWLEAKGVGKKTWNNYRGDLMAIFEWFCAPGRKWLAENPVAVVERFGKRSLARAHRKPSRFSP